MPESHNREINIVTLARGDTCGLFTEARVRLLTILPVPTDRILSR